jgi:hypothetical protein
LALCPSSDLRAKPELHATVPEVNDGAWHVGVASLIQADAVAMRQPEDVGHAGGVDEVLGVDPWSHALKATSVDGSVRPLG